MALNNHIDTDVFIDLLRSGDGDAVLVLLAPIIRKVVIEWMWTILQSMAEWMWSALKAIGQWWMILVITTGE